MRIDEAVQEIITSNHFNQKLRRTSWTHGDSLQIRNSGGYAAGELYWSASGKRAELFYVADLISNDWIVE